MTLEAELTKIQRAKTKAIETLTQMRIEKEKLIKDSNNNDTIDDWMSAILEEDVFISNHINICLGPF